LGTSGFALDAKEGFVARLGREGLWGPVHSFGSPWSFQMAMCCNGVCGLSKVLVVGALIAAAGLGVSTLVADDKPAETKQSETKPSETKPSENKPAEKKPAEGEKKEEVKVADPYVLDHTMKDIEGADQDLAQYKGKVVLMVNVASKCGFTTQYTGLQKLWDSKKEKGLVILGFPANDFGQQEPGSEKEIKEFCSSKYSVTFPMFSKVSVKGEDMCPLYKDLTSQASPVGGEVGWNFTKFLVSREGKVVARFDSRTRPDDVEMNRRIDELLGGGSETKETAKEGAKAGS
jgi:glutathione peroxidase